jgi:PleD family two-component response regulator
LTGLIEALSIIPPTLRTRPPLILVAADREPSASQAELALSRHGYTVFRAHTGRLALAAAKSIQPDVMVIDAFLAETDGLALCRTLRDDAEVGPSRPILLITNSRPTLSEHRTAMRCGVWEFLVEPLDAEEVTGRVDTYVLATTDARRRAPLRDEQGLYTPEGLARRGRELAVQAFHHHAGLACVLLATAREQDASVVAQRLRHVARRSDVVGRVGASEFAILAPGTDARGARLLAQRLAKAMGTADRAPPELRVGYDAVADVRRAPLEPRRMLDRAATALRRAREAAAGDWIRGYENR